MTGAAAPFVTVSVGDEPGRAVGCPVVFGRGLPLVLVAGPCQMESRDHALEMAEKIATIVQRLGMPWVFKASFDKANRTSLDTGRGLGLEKALPVFDEIRRTFGCPVVTDVHLPDQCAGVSAVVDMLQIPAFLCRQTDLLVAAARTGRVVHVKKGQFLAPWDMKHVARKIADQGNTRILLCERGVSFGYNTLVCDMRSLPVMQATGWPVVFDATHGVQQPGGQGATSGGERAFVPVLARAAVAVGVEGIFLETHQDPDRAPSDGTNMVPVQKLEGLLRVLKDLDQVAKAAGPVDVTPVQP